MGKIKADERRRIISDFQKAVSEHLRDGEKPDHAVIEFRNESSMRFPRPIKNIAISYLRFRKDNGRIASDVLDYEKNKAPLVEDSEEAQEILSKFLHDKDPEKTQELKNSIAQGGQRDPAIITCDGFLINGNRRKLALTLLLEETKDSKFEYMKVVVLPGESDDGGSPTNKEIEEVENRYQLQKDGKSEYTGFDQALSIRRKIATGLALESQLKDDPQYALLSDKDLKKVKQKYMKDYLDPLECVDEYLEYLGRAECYKTISSEKGDPEGRWQAFLDYSTKIDNKLRSEKERMKAGIKENEIGKIKDIAFKIIRQRSFPKIAKVHEVMRSFIGLYMNKDARNELKSILPIARDLPDAKKTGPDGIPISLKDQDKLWSSEFGPDIINHVKRAKHIVDRVDENTKPIDILRDTLRKLNDKKLIISKIPGAEFGTARELTVDIQSRASVIEDEIYICKKQYEKELKQLRKKHKK